MTKNNLVHKLSLAIILVSFYSCSEPEKYLITDNYIPCGWMGCGGVSDSFLQLDESWTENVHSGETCIKINVKNCEEDSGSGIYWINNKGISECNWGDAPGNDLSPNNFSTLSFWARGEKGKERIKFGIGGINKGGKLYKDSIEAQLFANLTTEWVEYKINVSKSNLSSVIGGFYWYSADSDNPNGATFYLDDIVLQ
jgi:hypothetical protein